MRVGGAALTIPCLYIDVNQSLIFGRIRSVSISGAPSIGVESLMTCANVLSILPPMFPALAQNLDKCLLPESQSMVTILLPFPSRLAVSTAATPVYVRRSTQPRETEPIQLTIDSCAAAYKDAVLFDKPPRHFKSLLVSHFDSIINQLSARL